MIGKVKTVNGIKQIIPISSETLIDSVAQGSMVAVTSNAVAEELNNRPSNFVFATMSDYTAVASTIPNGSLVLIEDEVNYVIGDNQ